MNVVLPLLNAAVFLLLAMLHLYWMIGGNWGYHAAIPTDGNGRKLFRPGPVATFAVALGLILFALVNILLAGLLPPVMPKEYLRISLMIIAGIFLLRAIGDFRYVGFSKRFRKTRFAEMDSKFYSPLCLVLAIMNSWWLIQ
ncbi:DUF3995 domain-containing protein [Dyadobacter sp. CY312]|uniref:DUF3995 domain-containing protein n=1 Tax=Dyadobacter sp. CY312 TaxID=2907303 RepID=UPI001F29B216|nr:DUF3995 domain-containing protein [Dyadobacter sp. CY312]MCE7044448.1 DUF3995 domain-containing protein [Dyadobacter sp. CY312]